jgi:hypothetical protein
MNYKIILIFLLMLSLHVEAGNKKECLALAIEHDNSREMGKCLGATDMYIISGYYSSKYDGKLLRRGQMEYAKSCRKCHGGGYDYLSKSEDNFWFLFLGKTPNNLNRVHADVKDYSGKRLRYNKKYNRLVYYLKYGSRDECMTGRSLSCIY